MTEVEKMLTNEMLACEGMIFIQMFLLLLMKEQSPDEFIEIANASEKGMVPFTINIPLPLKDLFEKIKEKTLIKYMEINFSQLSDENRKKGKEQINDVSETWLAASFGMNFVLGLLHALSDQGERNPEDILNQLVEHNKTSKSLASTLKELQG